MANSNLVGANLSTKQGEGGADVMQWGSLDRAANQIYQEQKQREARGYNEYMQGQAALQKEFANVRSADIPDVVNAYNDLKRVKQSILFDDKVKNDAVTLAKAQQLAQIKEAQLRQLIGGSQELKETDKQINARKVTHSEDFDDDKIKQHAIDLNLPLKQRLQEGRTDISPYLDNRPQTDFTKLSKDAMGSRLVVPVGERRIGDTPYELVQDQVSRYNNPLQYKANMDRALSTGKVAKDAAKAYNLLSPLEINKVQNDFNAIPDKEFEAMYGHKKSDITDGIADDDKARKFIALNAMQYALMNKPEKVAPKISPNQEYITAQKNAENDYEFRRAEKGRNYRANIVKPPYGSNGNDEYSPEVHIESIRKSGQNPEDIGVKPLVLNGKTISGKVVTLPPDVAAKYVEKIGSKTFAPDYFIMTEDAVYPVSSADTPQETARKRIPISQLKIDLTTDVGGSAFAKKKLFGKSNIEAPKATTGKVTPPPFKMK